MTNATNMHPSKSTFFACLFDTIANANAGAGANADADANANTDANASACPCPCPYAYAYADAYAYACANSKCQKPWKGIAIDLISRISDFEFPNRAKNFIYLVN